MNLALDTHARDTGAKIKPATRVATHTLAGAATSHLDHFADLLWLLLYDYRLLRLNGGGGLGHHHGRKE
jgi:hypothetical protein